MSELSEYLKEARTAEGWSLREVAKRCGLSNSMISHYELGFHIPGEASLHKLARVFGLREGYLVEARERAVAERKRKRERVKTKRFQKDNIIQGRDTKNIKWRVLSVRRDGTLLVERVIHPPRKVIKRPEFYHVVNTGG